MYRSGNIALVFDIGDTNILACAHRNDSALHEPAAALLRTRAEGLPAWPIARPVAHELCMQHCACELCSADRDFSRFPQSAVRNPRVISAKQA